jgi:hypothetical protein
MYIIVKTKNGRREFVTLRGKLSTEFPEAWKFADETKAMREMIRLYPMGSHDWEKYRVEEA